MGYKVDQWSLTCPHTPQHTLSQTRPQHYCSLSTMKNLLFVSCLFLFAALAMGQTTQTVDVSNATVAFSGDAVGTFIGT
jgi:hypothetical protein